MVIYSQNWLEKQLGAARRDGATPQDGRGSEEGGATLQVTWVDHVDGLMTKKIQLQNTRAGPLEIASHWMILGQTSRFFFFCSRHTDWMRLDDWHLCWWKMQMFKLSTDWISVPKEQTFFLFAKKQDRTSEAWKIMSALHPGSCEWHQHVITTFDKGFVGTWPFPHELPFSFLRSQMRVKALNNLGVKDGSSKSREFCGMCLKSKIMPWFRKGKLCTFIYCIIIYIYIYACCILYNNFVDKLFVNLHCVEEVDLVGGWSTLLKVNILGR